MVHCSIWHAPCWVASGCWRSCCSSPCRTLTPLSGRFTAWPSASATCCSGPPLPPPSPRPLCNLCRWPASTGASQWRRCCSGLPCGWLRHQPPGSARHCACCGAHHRCGRGGSAGPARSMAKPAPTRQTGFTCRASRETPGGFLSAASARLTNTCHPTTCSCCPMKCWPTGLHPPISACTC